MEARLSLAGRIEKFGAYLWMNDDELFFVVWLTDERRLALFPAATIVRDPHHRESPTRRQQDLNLRRTWVQALLNEVVQ